LLNAQGFGELVYEPFHLREFDAIVGFITPDDHGQTDSSEWVADCGCHRVDVDIGAGEDLANAQGA
jgi:hypothetical protein